jgi:hypothetical protein
MKCPHLRGTPAMSTSFKHMQAHHLSYAAFSNNDDAAAHLRGRRCTPGAKRMRGTEPAPDHAPERLTLVPLLP